MSTVLTGLVLATVALRQARRRMARLSAMADFYRRRAARSIQLVDLTPDWPLARPPMKPEEVLK